MVVDTEVGLDVKCERGTEASGVDNVPLMVLQTVVDGNSVLVNKSDSREGD